MTAEVSDSAQQPPARTLGQVFAAERERQGLSRADIAQRLHMSAYQVEALETGDYSRLPRGTFLRGFVRNYAKLIGLAPGDVLPLLDEGTPREARPGIVVPTQNIRFDPLGERFSSPYVKAGALAVVAIAIGFAAMYWWLFIRPTPPAAIAKKEAQPVTNELVSAPEIVAKTPIFEPAMPVETAKPQEPRAVEPKKEEPKKEEPKQADVKAPPPAPAVAMAAPKKDEPKSVEPKKTDAKAPPAPPAPAPAPAAAEPKKDDVVRVGSGGSTLKFRFKGESWVEIRDSKGRILLSRLNAAGSDVEVSGKPPFNVVIGNAPDVELFYNDHEFDLEPHTKVAVARFTIE